MVNPTAHFGGLRVLVKVGEATLRKGSFVQRAIPKRRLPMAVRLAAVALATPLLIAGGVLPLVAFIPTPEAPSTSLWFKIFASLLLIVLWVSAWWLIDVAEYRTAQEKEEAPIIAAQRAARREERSRKIDAHMKRWYCRYPIAAALLYFAFNLPPQKNDKDCWLPIVMVLGAAVFAHELSLLLIGCGVFYLLVNGIASLPVSVAVIIGACIIAAASKR
jgi:hypothetical protein